jgi:branched-chain amino acid transport system permease protein
MDRRFLVQRLASKYQTPGILCLGLLGIVLLAEGFGTNLIERMVTETFILLVAVVGVYIFVGNSGIFSFGHIGLMAIGAYATAWQTCCPQLKQFTMEGLPDFLLNNTFPVFFASITSGVLTAFVALAVGAVLMKLSGIVAAISTFAFLVIVNVVYSGWNSVTAGTSSIVGIPTYVDMWVSLGWSAVVIFMAYLYQTSSRGLALQSSREDAIAAKASGINVFHERLVAFVLSGFVVGIAGVLYAHFLGVINPDAFYLGLTFVTLAMLVVGGVNSLSGAVVGVVVLSTLINVLRWMESGITAGGFTLALPNGVQEIVLGAVMVVILITRRGGITGNREISVAFRRSSLAR